MENKKESPLQGIIDKMYFRISDPEVTPNKLSYVIRLAFESREGLLEGSEEGLPENDWWANKAILDYTEIIVRANHKAHQMVNPGLVRDDVEEEVKSALHDISKKLITR